MITVHLSGLKIRRTTCIDFKLKIEIPFGLFIHGEDIFLDTFIFTTNGKTISKSHKIGAGYNQELVSIDTSDISPNEEWIIDSIIIKNTVFSYTEFNSNGTDLNDIQLELVGLEYVY